MIPFIFHGQKNSWAPKDFRMFFFPSSEVFIPLIIRGGDIGDWLNEIGETNWIDYF